MNDIIIGSAYWLRILKLIMIVFLFPIFTCSSLIFIVHLECKRYKNNFVCVSLCKQCQLIGDSFVECLHFVNLLLLLHTLDLCVIHIIENQLTFLIFVTL